MILKRFLYIFLECIFQKKMLKRTAAIISAASILYTGFVAPVQSDVYDGPASYAIAEAASQSAFSEVIPQEDNLNWTFYWYLCGTDLETDYNAGSDNLRDLFSKPMPPGNRVIVLAGGANSWDLDFLKDKKQTLFMYDSSGIHVLATYDKVDMGSADTLAEFLALSQDDSSAHKAFIGWNHGGGPLYGMCWDQLTGNNIKTHEILQAFEYGAGYNPEKPAFDIIALDMCLMGSIEFATGLYGYGDYYVASEDLGQGCGYDYSLIPEAIAKNPDISVKDMAIGMADGYYMHTVRTLCDPTVTISVVDLSKMPELAEAYDQFSHDAIAATTLKSTISEFSRAARGAEKLDNGSYDTIDLWDLANGTDNLIPESSRKLKKAIEDSVVFMENGVYRQNSHGIAVYYPINVEMDNFNTYHHLPSANKNAASLYNRIMNSDLFKISDLTDTPTWTDQEYAYVMLEQNEMDELASVKCVVGIYDDEDDSFIFLGNDGNVDADWETGVFADNFSATWPSLNGIPLNIDVTNWTDEYITYTSPISVNDINCLLEFVYDYKDNQLHIIGAHPYTDNGVPSRNFIEIKKGDIITPYYVEYDVDDYSYENGRIITLGSFELNDNPYMEDADLDDGLYIYHFMFTTPQNESTISSSAFIEVSDGEYTVTADIDIDEDDGEEDLDAA